MCECPVTIPASILLDKTLTSNHKIIYGRVYSFRPEPCYMRTSDFAKELGLTLLTIRHALKELKMRNLLRTSTYGGLEAVDFDKLKTAAEEKRTSDNSSKEESK